MIKDLKRVLKRLFRDSKTSLKHLPLLIVGLLGVSLIMYFVNQLQLLVTTVSNFSGIIKYFIKIAIISSLFNALQNIILYDRLNQNHFFEFSRFLSPVIQFLFVIYIIEILFGIIVSIGIMPSFIYRIFEFAILVFISPGYEMIYIDEYNGYEVYQRIIPFFRENWYIWILGILMNIGIEAMFSVISTATYVGIPSFIISAVIGSAVIGLLLILKGNLYNILAHSSRRKRDFEDKF